MQKQKRIASVIYPCDVGDHHHVREACRGLSLGLEEDRPAALVGMMNSLDSGHHGPALAADTVDQVQPLPSYSADHIL